MNRSSFRNLAAIAFGCLLVLAAIALAEGALWLYEGTPPEPVETWTTPYMVAEPTLGLRPLPSVRTQTQKRLGDKVLYDVTYTFDEHRRRVVPADADATYNRFLLFFGDSNTFGEGLNDDETVPYFVSREIRGAHAYNFGFRGYGPQHILAWLESTDLRREIPERGGTAVFMYLTFLVDRLIGGSRTLAWSKSLPYYRFENGDVVRDGILQTQYPFYYWTMATIGQSLLMRRLNIAWPPRPRPEDIEFVCAVFGKAHALLEQQLGPTPLVVVMHPKGGDASGGDARAVAACLAPRGINVLDYHTLFADAGNEGFSIPVDGHTTGRGNRLIAERLGADLRPFLSGGR